MHTFIWRDVRLKGWKPAGDVIESNFDTPVDWLINRINDRGAAHNGELIVKIMCHGLPGYLQCCRGRVQHPACGPGITSYDLPAFEKIRGSLKRLELQACLVARIGWSPECGDVEAYDGNAFCFKLAQTIQAEVVASIHIQYYTPGNDVNGKPTGKGSSYNTWNGRVFTWDSSGKIIKTEDFPQTDYPKKEWYQQ